MVGSALIYKTAAVLDIISIAGHTLMGLKIVHPTLGSIQTETSHDRRVGQRGAETAWNYFNASLVVSGKPIDCEDSAVDRR